MRYNFYSDASHGWLKVSLQELKELQIDHLVSHYSYQKGDYVYLEEDGDLKLFIDAKLPDHTGAEYLSWWSAEQPQQYQGL